MSLIKNKIFKKGFTLVELLAVIAILAVILAIAIPSITGITANATENAFKSDAKILIKAIKLAKSQNESLDFSTINKTYVQNTLGMNTTNYESVTVTLSGSEPSVTIVGTNKYDNLNATGTYYTITVSEPSSDTTPPVITLLGYNPTMLPALSDYTESGATATDNIDGNITANIIIDDSDFVPNTVGTFYIHYTVSDSSNNTTVVDRTVIATAGGPMN
ncbi:MAG: DUF5011 domain-containing protein [Bacilli bacterium]|nr:DUF5011 domain-containing protein [Bacilli bacterium]